MINVKCTNPHCGRTLQAPVALASKTVRCPSCKALVEIPPEPVKSNEGRKSPSREPVQGRSPPPHSSRMRVDDQTATTSHPKRKEGIRIPAEEREEANSVTTNSTNWLMLGAVLLISMTVGVASGFVFGHHQGKVSNAQEAVEAQVRASKAEHALRERESEVAEAQARASKTKQTLGERESELSRLTANQAKESEQLQDKLAALQQSEKAAVRQLDELKQFVRQQAEEKRKRDEKADDEQVRFVKERIASEIVSGQTLAAFRTMYPESKEVTKSTESTINYRTFTLYSNTYGFLDDKLVFKVMITPRSLEAWQRDIAQLQKNIGNPFYTVVSDDDKRNGIVLREEYKFNDADVYITCTVKGGGDAYFLVQQIASIKGREEVMKRLKR